MHTWQAIFYLVSIGLLVGAAIGIVTRVNLAFLAAAFFVLAFAWPVLSAL